MEATRLELKYCEMCGALGLRRSQSNESYCEPCARRLTEHSLPRGWRPPLRKRQARITTAPRPPQASLAPGVLQ